MIGRSRGQGRVEVNQVVPRERGGGARGAARPLGAHHAGGVARRVSGRIFGGVDRGVGGQGSTLEVRALSFWLLLFITNVCLLVSLFVGSCVFVLVYIVFCLFLSAVTLKNFIVPN